MKPIFPILLACCALAGGAPTVVPIEVLPANKLALGLWLESDRMRSLAITPENLTNQKEAVKQVTKAN